MTQWIVSLAGVAALAAFTGAVYRDAIRVGVRRPTGWAALVFATGGVALATRLAVETVPLPGLLVVALAGPAFYLFERDDATHGGEPADPHTLPDGRSDRPGSDPEE